MEELKEKRRVRNITNTPKVKKSVNREKSIKGLTKEEAYELKQFKEYLSYEQLLQEKNNLLIDISNKKETLNCLDNDIEEYQGGLKNYRAKELNTLYGILSKVVNLTIGFVTAGVIYNGPNVLKTPSLWLYLGTISAIYALISIFEYSRYKNISKKER